MSSTIPAESEQITYVAIGRLLSNSSNPRRELRDMDDLVASIREKGILVPLTVEQNGGNFRIIAGHRRMAAAKAVGLLKVPCIVRRYTEDNRLEAMLVDNIQRNDLNLMEEAEAFQQLVERGVKVPEIAKRIGKTAATVYNRLKLLDLDAADRRAVAKGKLTMTEALGYLPSIAKNTDRCRTCGQKLRKKAS